MHRFCRFNILLTLLITFSFAMLSTPTAYAQKSTAKTSAQMKATPKATDKKQSAKKAQNQKKQPAKKQPTVSSAELKKQQKSTQLEIKETKAKIAGNERSVSQGVADLSRIDADIKVNQKQVADLSSQVNSLNSKITSLQQQIAANEKELKAMRNDYLAAVKKMRLARGYNSKLSFIFSSKNFSQAMRRIRYLRQFDAWRDRQTKAIKKKNDQLIAQNKQLTAAQADKRTALSRQQQAQQTLSKQYAKQDALVTSLRQQGDKLRAHLAKKQTEANDLNSSISAAIAMEQQREAERRKADEQKRIAEQQRRQAEQQRLAEEQKRRNTEEQKRLEAQRNEKKNSGDMAQVRDLPAAKKSAPKKKAEHTKQQSEKAKKEKNKEQSTGRSYAEARRRAPRSGDNDAKSTSTAKSALTAKSPSATTSANVATTTGSGGFEKMRGSLPHPVAGAFRITSPFGRHALPELPGVTYDNPGIDAEVSANANAQAVYPGKVTGIYRLPGYNTVVIVSHGNYYTVYGNLATTAVKNGDAVKAGQVIGKVANSDDGGRPSIHFEVWKNREKLNPAEWIR